MGQNNIGQLGLGNTTYYSSPKQVGALTSWLKVSGGYTFTMAIKTDGTLWSWGTNAQGQLGLGIATGNTRSSPVQVGALTNWSSVSCGNTHVLAITSVSTLLAWGNNYSGQLGLGNIGLYTNRSSPVQVGSLTTWLSVSAGKYFSFATRTNNTLWAWGQNNAGQLGQSGSYKSVPSQVGALTNWGNLGTPLKGNFILVTSF